MAGNNMKKEPIRLIDIKRIQFVNKLDPNGESTVETEIVSLHSQGENNKRRKIKLVSCVALVLIVSIAMLALQQIQMEEAHILCVKLIQKVDEDVSECQNLHNTTKLQKVTQLAYKGDPTNVIKIVNFVCHLPDCSQKLTVYSTLLKEKGVSEYLNTTEKLMILKDIVICKHNHDSLKPQFDSVVSQLCSKWTDEIRNGRSEGILPWMNKNPMNGYLSTLVSDSFSNNLTNFQNVLNFIGDFQEFTLFREGCAMLLTEMTKGGWLYSFETIKLAYKIRERMTYRVHVNLSEQEQSQLDFLIMSLPDSVVGLIWNSDNCTIENERFKEYLIVSAYKVNKTHRVWTWVPKFAGQDRFWKIETQNKGLSFTLKNNRYDMYLFANALYKDSSRRLVHGWVNGKPNYQGFWKLKPLEGSKFIILHKFDQEYLYADGDMSYGHGGDRRGVFTDKNATCNRNDAYHWNIVCNP